MQLSLELLQPAVLRSIAFDLIRDLLDCIFRFLICSLQVIRGAIVAVDSLPGNLDRVLLRTNFLLRTVEVLLSSLDNVLLHANLIGTVCFHTCCAAPPIHRA